MDVSGSNFDYLIKPTLGMIDTTNLCRLFTEEESAGASFIAAHNGAKEVSDSSSTCNQSQPNKRHKHQHLSTPSKFKGVVLQQNGHWGAQIYADHQRIWLGTFKSEQAAAMAYDSAAIKLRSGDPHRNLPWNNTTLQEPSFQNLYTTEAVLNMIKDGSYESRFNEFMRTKSSNHVNNNMGLEFETGRASIGGVVHRQLFQKELTPSDVGKLNRLVIPKKHAMRSFPSMCEDEDRNVDDTHLEFLDESLRSWNFRYRYWKSSQSFVFTRGWSRFVKARKLKAKDVVLFYRCEREGEVLNMIKVDYKEGGGGGDGGCDWRMLSNIQEGKEGKSLGNLWIGGGGSNWEGQEMVDMRDGGCGSDLEGEIITHIRRGGCGSDLEGKMLAHIRGGVFGSEPKMDEEHLVDANQEKCVRLFGVVIS